MSTLTKTMLGIVAGLVVIYFSLDIRKTGAPANQQEGFDLAAYTKVLWEKDLPEVARQGTVIGPLLDALQADPENTCRAKGHKLGISNTVYFFVRGSGTVTSVEDENLLLTLTDGRRVRIATDFIFGNAVREASGLVNIDDFLNMTDFNNVSVELNRRIRDNVAKPLRNAAVTGSEVEFAGAFEVNESHPATEDIRIIPVVAEIIPASHD